MNRNRTAGHTWERTCINTLKKIPYFKNITSTRAESVTRDAQGIDIINKDEDENGRLVFDLQCKTTSTSLNYKKVLESMQIKKMPVILHRQTEKKGNQFYKQEDYAILLMDDFIKILKTINVKTFKQIQK